MKKILTCLIVISLLIISTFIYAHEQGCGQGCCAVTEQGEIIEEELIVIGERYLILKAIVEYTQSSPTIFNFTFTDTSSCGQYQTGDVLTNFDVRIFGITKKQFRRMIYNQEDWTDCPDGKHYKYLIGLSLTPAEKDYNRKRFEERKNRRETRNDKEIERDLKMSIEKQRAKAIRNYQDIQALALADILEAIKGNRGVRGSKGGEGGKGDKGDEGEKGSQGDEGEKGDKGDSGKDKDKDKKDKDK